MWNSNYFVLSTRMFCYLRKKGMDIYLTVIVINIEKKKNYWNYTYLRKRYYIFKVGCKLKMVPFCVDKYHPRRPRADSGGDSGRNSAFWLVPENVCVFLPNQKAERRRPFGTGLVRQCPQGLFTPFFTFLRAIFFRPFRLSLAPTICPWDSEDGQIYTQSQTHS